MPIIIVQPGMTLPIIVGQATGTTDNSLNVSYSVQTPNLNAAQILISICIRVRIGSVVIKIYFSRLSIADGRQEVFEGILPIGSIIEEIEPNYQAVEIA